MKRYYTGVIIFFVLLSGGKLFAQNQDVQVTIIASRAKSTYNAKNESEDYRWKPVYKNSTTGKANNAVCMKSGGTPNTWATLNSYLVTSQAAKINDEIIIFGEGWEEDGCKGDCDYNNTKIGCDDNAHCGSSEGTISGGPSISAGSFRLYDYRPGVTNTIEIAYCGGSNTIEFKIKYTPPGPEISAVEVNGVNCTGQVCPDCQVRLPVRTSINPNFQNDLQFTWEYQIAGMWYSLGTTYGNQDGGAKTFKPSELQRINTISRNTSVTFRVRTVANGVQSTAYGSKPVMLSPPAPRGGTVTMEPSCPETATGILYISGVTSQFSKYRYLLKKGDVQTVTCDPAKDNSCLSPEDISGSASGDSFSITGVKAETYSLFLMNNASTYGFCPRKVGTYTIPAIPNLQVAPFTPQDIMCNGVNEGAFTVSTSGGRYTTVHYDLLNQTTAVYATKSSTTANAVISFDQLSPGIYQLNVNDQCTPDVVRNFEIRQPAKVKSIAFEKVNATCSDPGNGVAKIAVTKTTSPDVSVTQVYQYQLFKDGVLYNETEQEASTYTWTGLPVSKNYKVLVKEKGGEDCNGAVVLFAIDGPASLGATAPVLEAVTCYNGADGSITVKGTGGTGSYIYELSGNAVSNSTGEFKGLRAGKYSVTIRNTISCNDKYILPDIIIDQPAQVVATISKKDISCYGLTDGELYSTVVGGTVGASGYTYTWEKSIGSSWTQLSVTTASLQRQSAGIYRLKVKDDHACPAVSDEVTIVEPAAVGISAVNVSDIKCLGETGNIAITGTGGTGVYSFSYSPNNSSGFTDFHASTPFSAGVYRVKITDTNGCSYLDPDQYKITEPVTALAFTETLSDYNGYTISCYGGGDGYAILTASGGNGAAYTGYKYALDSGVFQENQTLTGIYAGSHKLNVKDARGCIVSHTVNFTQTDAKLSTQLIEKKDIVCYGDATGALEFTGTGGLPPYRYSLDDGSFLDQGRFINLPMGEHTITIKDRNDCDNATRENIVVINPRIDIATAIKDVSCFGGNDGSITASVTGGVPPFQYQWNGTNAVAPRAAGLSQGTYIVYVTDAAGCAMQASANVQQPYQALQTRLVTVPVCYGRINGSITVTTTGGTTPYEYSIDNGQTYQASAVFLEGVGEYTITSRDSKGCTIQAATNVVLRNDKPEPNFLVASTRNALDTLVIIDVSVPKPDSIYWMFDPQAIVISNDPWSPQLRFLDAGTYFVSMTGYFGGCDYAVTKNLKVSPYDPSIENEKLPGYKPIQSVTVTPNPSSGTFEISVKLVRKYNLSIVVYDVLGTRHYENTWSGIEDLKQSITLGNASSGVYLLRVITESDAQDVRILINK